MTGNGGQVAVPLDNVEQAIPDIAAGRPVVVVDDADRENEGDIIVAASKMTPELMAFMIRHTSGVICVPLPGEDLDRLQLPLMTAQNSERMRTAFTISVDARDGVTTGISAEDRARTVRTLVDSATEPYEIVRPGHIFPLRYAEGGVLRRPGHTEAAVDLARLAGLTPAGVLAEVVNDDGTMARLPAAARLRRRARPGADLDRPAHRVPAALRAAWSTGSWRPGCPTPTASGGPSATRTRSTAPSTSRWCSGIWVTAQDVLARVHSECLTGDVLGSRRCDCGAQLEARWRRSPPRAAASCCYLRGHEGRGIGLLSKLRAYQLQDGGRGHGGRQPGTRPARGRPGLLHRRADPRRPGVRSVRLLTNNPAKVGRAGRPAASR